MEVDAKEGKPIY